MYNLTNFKSTSSNYETNNAGVVHSVTTFDSSGISHVIEDQKEFQFTYYRSYHEITGWVFFEHKQKK